jgi:Rps23 Pro-64 3,4-dihydroxylase Tpa1-like proline 4-hydroxylase
MPKVNLMTRTDLQTQNELLAALKCEVKLPQDLRSLQSEYQNAKPYPHLVLDNVFSATALEGILAEMPDWNSETMVQQKEDYLTKASLRSAVDMGDRTFDFVSAIHAAPFLYLISQITGVDALLPDPYMTGAGLTIVPEGGRFDIHADRNTDHYCGLKRRLVMLIYLNKDWSPALGGQLELWDSAATACQKAVTPEFNRVVLFQVEDTNLHAVRPVSKGSGRVRRSLTVYYHTVDSQVVLHNSIYAPRYLQKKEPFLRRASREVLPPFLHRLIKRVIRG